MKSERYIPNYKNIPEHIRIDSTQYRSNSTGSDYAQKRWEGRIEIRAEKDSVVYIGDAEQIAAYIGVTAVRVRKQVKDSLMCDGWKLSHTGKKIRGRKR